MPTTKLNTLITVLFISLLLTTTFASQDKLVNTEVNDEAVFNREIAAFYDNYRSLSKCAFDELKNSSCSGIKRNWKAPVNGSLEDWKVKYSFFEFIQLID